MAQTLVAEHPDLHMQTHLSENRDEIDYTLSLYPQARDYLDVYETYGLLGPKSLFGHAIHLSDRETAAMAATGSIAVFCPTSNLFLGSGLYDKVGLREQGVRRAIATDVGGGTSYSMLRTLDEGYKVLALRGQKLDPLKAFWWITRGNAEALGLADTIGTLAPGTEADIVVLDSAAPPRRWRSAPRPSRPSPRSSSCSRPSATTAPSPPPTSWASAGGRSGRRSTTRRTHHERRRPEPGIRPRRGQRHARGGPRKRPPAGLIRERALAAKTLASYGRSTPIWPPRCGPTTSTATSRCFTTDYPLRAQAQPRIRYRCDRDEMAALLGTGACGRRRRPRRSRICAASTRTTTSLVTQPRALTRSDRRIGATRRSPPVGSANLRGRRVVERPCWPACGQCRVEATGPLSASLPSRPIADREARSGWRSSGRERSGATAGFSSVGRDDRARPGGIRVIRQTVRTGGSSDDPNSCGSSVVPERLEDQKRFQLTGCR